ncbi:hypothetical protein BVY03_00355 [bacterium K02(2017)]|nr:hypothetical protein BVY03_00355 [bacterium K02(2017)]
MLTYLAIFLTGLTALTYQVLWQKQLSLLLGSESQSLALITGIFLSGLSLGYYFWGNWIAKNNKKNIIYQSYGYIELVIGLYAILYPYFFNFILNIHSNYPNSFGINIIFTSLMLGLPTFLMGATLPFMTKVIPITKSSVSSIHAKIYGLNTLGSFAGVILALYYLIPINGNKFTFILMGIINLVIGCYFLSLKDLNKTLSHSTKQSHHKIEALPKNLILSMSLITGLVSIGLEIILFRIVTLSMGSNYHVYPFILSIIILGLGIGSLSSFNNKNNYLSILTNWIFLLIFLVLLYLSMPYWSYWISILRLNWGTAQDSYFLYYLLLYLCLCVLILPSAIFFGRILPQCFSLLQKEAKDFGKEAGLLYFSNTIGTLIGATIFGFALLYLINIDTILIIFLILIAIITIIIILRTRKYNAFLIITPLLILLVWQGNWDRSSHIIGLYRANNKQSYHDGKIFKTPMGRKITGTKLLKDGPNATVSITEFKTKKSTHKSMMVNARTEGSSYIGDLQPQILIGLLPYVYHPKTQDLNAFVVGLATGITPGFLSQLPLINTIDVAEISDLVIKTAAYFKNENFDVLNNPKVFIKALDAARFLILSDKKYDLIVSHTSTHWVSGIENLITPQFYQTVNDRLTPDGIFTQWLQGYETNSQIALSVLKIVGDQFKYYKVFEVGSNEMVIMASNTKLNIPDISKKITNQSLLKISNKLNLYHFSQFEMLEILDKTIIDHIIAKNQKNLFEHHAFKSKLQKRATKAEFLKKNINLETLIDNKNRRRLQQKLTKRHLIHDNLYSFFIENPQHCRKLNSMACQNWFGFNNIFQKFNTTENDLEYLKIYSILRNRNYIPLQKEELIKIENKILTSENKDAKLIKLLVNEYRYENLDKLANEFLEKL